MNAYTHVDTADLASDVESLPLVIGGPQKKAKPAVPADLASLAGNPSPLHSVVASWDSLPDHVRQAIATLAAA
jgi:hypothetical protein